jgi:hypothetical protein
MGLSFTPTDPSQSEALQQMRSKKHSPRPLEEVLEVSAVNSISIVPATGVVRGNCCIGNNAQAAGAGG